MAEMTTEEATKRLIDSLKNTCGAFGLGNDGNEYKVIVQIFLYKYFNDKFGYEAKKNAVFGEVLSKAEKWDAEYDTFNAKEVAELFSYLPPATPRLKPEHTIAHLFNRMQQGDFATILDSTLKSVAQLNSDIFSITTESKTKITVFDDRLIHDVIVDEGQRDAFAVSLMRHIADPEINFERIFAMKYDFFSTMFEYLIKDYNKDGGGKYAEYYTPRSIATIIARLLIGGAKNLRNMTVCDPSAGSGSLVMAVAHEIGDGRCTIFTQDISQKSSQMLRLNLILNNLPDSIQNVIQGDTLLHPGHKEKDGRLKKFKCIVSNPPFKHDFPGTRDTLAADTIRFWAGVPNAPKEVNPGKPKMKIFLCFIQHMLNSLADDGKGAIVVPTGFITSKEGIEKKILHRIVDEHIVYGCVSMPPNVFATTNTNVSVLFFDNSRKQDKVMLIDASKLGEEYKDGNNQRTRLRDFEIDKIVNTFVEKKAVEDFSVVVSHDAIKEKGYALSAGIYFDVKIEHVDITAAEFKRRIGEYEANLDAIDNEFSKLFKQVKIGLRGLGL